MKDLENRVQELEEYVLILRETIEQLDDFIQRRLCKIDELGRSYNAIHEAMTNSFGKFQDRLELIESRSDELPFW